MCLSKMSTPSSLFFLFFFVLLVGVVIIEPCGAQNTRQDYVNAHNAARKAVNKGLPNMTWSSTLERYANKYVRARLSSCSFVHSGGPYGENLAGGTGTFSGTDAVKLWTNEKSCYVYSSNTCRTSATCKPGCLHYTQVVSRKSVRVGCARLKCANGWWFISCNYDPPGNYVGQKPY